jgi:hypothetical protein
MNHATVEVRDAVSAVMIMETSMQATGLSSGRSTFHADFPADAENDYLQQGSRQPSYVMRLLIFLYS